MATNAIKYLFFVLSFCIFSLSSSGQTRKIDSLLTLIKKDNADTNKVKHLCSLSREFAFKNIDSSIAISNQAVNILKHLSPQLKERQLKPFLASTYGDLGIFYMFKGNYPSSLECLLKALKLDEEMGNKAGKAKRICNIGIVFEKQYDYDKALEYYFRALEMAKELEDTKGIAADLNNIGSIYIKQKDYPKALKYLLNSLDIYIKLSSKNEIAMCLANIGGVYSSQQNYQEALNYLFRYLEIAEEINNKSYQAHAIGRIGSLYLDTKEYGKAEPFLKKSILMNDSIGLLNALKEDEYLLSNLYDSTERYKLAFEWFKKAKAHEDSIYNEANEKRLVEQEMTYLFNIKEKEAIALQEKKDALTAQDKQRQKLIIYSVSAGLFLMLLLALFIFRSYKQKQKANIIITQQKAEVEKQKELIEEKNRLVEEKHKEITDSINYAKRIQRALFASKRRLGNNLKNYFILFKPKEAVSGDFYSAIKLKNNHFVLVTADSTGHGVPGAIMSILNIACLRTAVTQGITQPDLLLNETRRLIIKTLKNDGSEEGGKDGMDGSVLSFDFENNTLYCAAANNPVWIIRNGEFIEIKADRMPVGKHDKDTVPFTLHTFPLQKNDVIYTLTDGYADQFGGPKGKKFKQKQLQDVLLTIYNEPMETQKQRLDDIFIEWMGELEQVDDVCLIGIRI